jgi:hypothetical protein
MSSGFRLHSANQYVFFPFRGIVGIYMVAPRRCRNRGPPPGRPASTRSNMGARALRTASAVAGQ